MPASIEDLARDAMALPEEQRFTLAHRILSSVEPPITTAIEKVWEQEIGERIRRYKEGKATTIPAEEVFAELDTLLQPK